MCMECAVNTTLAAGILYEFRFYLYWFKSHLFTRLK